MKSIGSTGAQWRASLRQPNNRMSSISKRLAALNQRGIGPNRRTFVFYGSKNKTPGSYRQQNSCDFASLGASLTSEVTPSRGGDSIIKLAKRQSRKIKNDDLALRKSSVELIGVTPPPIQEVLEVSPESSSPSPLAENTSLDVDQTTSDPYANTRKFLENYHELVFCCDKSAADSEPGNVENTENSAVESQSAAAPNITENAETQYENLIIENRAISNSLSEHESPCNETPAAVEAVAAMDSAPKSVDAALVPPAQNSILETIAMVAASVKNPTDPASPTHQTLTSPEEKTTKGKTLSRKRRSGRKPEKKSIFQTDSHSEDDSSHVRYRKLFYSERENKWVEHLILEEDEPSGTDSKCKDEKEKFDLPHLVKGRQTQRFKQWLPTAFIKTERNRCFYDRIHVTDELRMELHKRKMPVVGSYFQEHIFKFGKLPFRGNPRPH